MITATLDTITLHDLTDLENAPCVIESEGEGALRIYFEAEEKLNDRWEARRLSEANKPGKTLHTWMSTR